ncbi:MAG TPA: MBOAT family O-acyltransferase [Chitinophagales bacterium]|nr:MBOAT family O-acyltransferase [Chitinophagales bacterium]
MLFNSIYFLFLFVPVFFTVYFLLPDKYKNPFTLAASILFYAWGAPTFVFILGTAVIADFFLAQQIHRSTGNARKWWLAFALTINTSILLYFKYANFFVDNFCSLFGCEGQHLAQVLLPIGISFFTFHEVSYLVDVYRQTKTPFKSVVNYALYIFLFPQLIAGPIIRFHEIADQIENRKYNDTPDNKLLGFFRFTMGLGKKVLIADVLGVYVTNVFTHIGAGPDVGSLWLGAVMNLIHFYIDFSAYSDMAIGLALVMGFRFPENFNYPFTAQSLTDYWQRWHMSLYRWMREYLYIPLGGSKHGEARTAFNIFFVFLFSGFWHGASWNFVLWGAGHGLVVMSERYVTGNLLERLNKYVRVVYTFLVMTLLLVVFRTDTIHDAGNYLKLMFTGRGSANYMFLSLKQQMVLVLALLISFGGLNTRLQQWANKLYVPFGSDMQYNVGVLVAFIIIIISASMLVVTGYNPFLYFKF